MSRPRTASLVITGILALTACSGPAEPEPEPTTPWQACVQQADENPAYAEALERWEDELEKRPQPDEETEQEARDAYVEAYLESYCIAAGVDRD